MKHKFISFLLLMMAAIALFTTTASAGDVVDDFAEDMRSFQAEITVPVRDFDALMKETFSRYPELCYYYDGCSYSSTTEGLTINMKYRNTATDLEDVYIVDSEDELMAVIGLLMCDLGDGVEVMLTNGYEVDSNSIYDRLYADYYLIAQGLNFRFNNGIVWKEHGITTYTINLFYCDATPRDTVRRWRTETEAKLLELAGSLFALDMPDYQKLFLIHDWLVDSCVYDMDDINVELEWVNHVAYGCLCEGSGVCQSYAEATKMLCDAAGIPCYNVVGDAGGAHQWNMVQLEGEWYLLDTTWDDPVTTDGSNVKVYDYFLITSEQMRKNHTWDEGELPICTSTALNYETVLERMAADTNTYTNYSTQLVRTEAMQRSELEAILGLNDPVEEPEEPVDEQEEPVDEQEEPVDEPEEPVDEQEEPVDEQEEPVDEQEEPVDEQEEPADEQEEPAEEPEDEPDLEPVLPEELDLVVLIDEQKQQEYIQLNWIALVIALALFVAVTAIALNCVANGRVMSARGERQKEREIRVKNGPRKGVRR